MKSQGAGAHTNILSQGPGFLATALPLTHPKIGLPRFFFLYKKTEGRVAGVVYLKYLAEWVRGLGCYWLLGVQAFLSLLPFPLWGGDTTRSETQTQDQNRWDSCRIRVCLNIKLESMPGLH